MISAKNLLFLFYTTQIFFLPYFMRCGNLVLCPCRSFLKMEWRNWCYRWRSRGERMRRRPWLLCRKPHRRKLMLSARLRRCRWNSHQSLLFPLNFHIVQPDLIGPSFLKRICWGDNVLRTGSTRYGASRGTEVAEPLQRADAELWTAEGESSPQQWPAAAAAHWSPGMVHKES